MKKIKIPKYSIFVICDSKGLPFFANYNNLDNPQSRAWAFKTRKEAQTCSWDDEQVIEYVQL